MGVLTAAIGAAALTRWVVLPGRLPALDPIVGPIRPEGAAALVLAGVSLVLLTGRPRRARRWAGDVLAAAAAVIGLIAVADHLRGSDTSLLHLGGATGLMTPAGATAVLLAGLALILLDRPANSGIPWPQTFAPAAAAIACVSVLAYILDLTDAVPRLAALTAMPGPAAIAVLLLAVGTMLARPDRGLLRPFGSAGPGAALARRLTPTLVVLPFAVVLLSVLIIRLSHSPPALAFAVSTAAAVIVLVLMVGGTVRAIDGADDRQHRLMAELKAERDFTNTLLQSLSEAVAVYDRDLRVIDINPRGCQLLGRSREQVVGQRPPYPWQPDGGGAPTLAGNAGDDPAGGGRYVERSDGTRVPVLSRLSPVLDEHGRPRAFVGTFVDITGLKRAEAALAERAGALEAANNGLRDSNRRLEEAAEFKRDLMSLMSHEVSQPLSSVASLAELLATDWAELPDEVRQELAQKVDNNTRRLTRMINDMLLLFRLDAGAVSARRESVPVGEVVDTVADSAPATAQVVPLVDPDVYALVDRGHLWQALGNLVNNAMAYGEPPIEISGEYRPDGVVIGVRDHGRGIPEADLPQLFDRVARRRGGRSTKGSGLGLFIVRHLVEVNGGRIWYEPAEPQGARLMIRLEPAAPAPPAEPLTGAERRGREHPAASPTPTGVPPAGVPPADHGHIVVK